jgi:integrase
VKLVRIRSAFWIPLQLDLELTTADGRARYGFHSIRHATPSLFIANLGWSPKRVQTVLGHASITMTYDRYGHLFEDNDSDRKAMKKLEVAILAA